MEYGVVNIFPRGMWEDHRDSSEALFQMEADKFDLKLENADLRTQYMTWIGSDEDGMFIPAPEETADYINIAYRWKS